MIQNWNETNYPENKSGINQTITKKLKKKKEPKSPERAECMIHGLKDTLTYTDLVWFILWFLILVQE